MTYEQACKFLNGTTVLYDLAGGDNKRHRYESLILADPAKGASIKPLDVKKVPGEPIFRWSFSDHKTNPRFCFAEFIPGRPRDIIKFAQIVKKAETSHGLPLVTAEDVTEVMGGGASWVGASCAFA